LLELRLFSAGCGNSDQDWPAPPKMLFPRVRTRVEQPRERGRFRVNAGDVRAFMEVAVVATEGEIVRDGRTAVLAGDNVVDDETESPAALGGLAVFAAELGASSDLLCERLIHR